MTFIAEFESHLPKNLHKKFNQLDSPFAIQNYLDSLAYNGEERDRSPLNVMLDGQGHCLDGGFLPRGAAADDEQVVLVLRHNPF